MKHIRILTLILALLGGAMLSPLNIGRSTAQESNDGCEIVGGTFLINFIDPTTGVAVLTGDISGGVRGIIVDSSVDDNGVMTLTLEHVIITTSGYFIMTSDEATLTPVEENVFFMRQTQTIVGGTGPYLNATGTLIEFGAVDMGTGEAILRYSGEICTGM